MRSPEEFCRQIDIKLNRSIIITFSAISAAVIAAGAIIYIFAPKDDFLVSKFSGHSCSTGLSGDFILTPSQSYDKVSVEALSCDISEDGFTVTVQAANSGKKALVLSPAKLNVYATDTARGSKPNVCRTDMTENVVIPAGSSADFTVSGSFPEGCNYETSRITLVFTDSESGNTYSIMPE